MYKSFEIKNFKCFEHLKLDNLARVNLIAGKNSVGKSALLEAIYQHCDGRNPWLLSRVRALRRVELGGSSRAQSMTHLFGEFVRDFDAESRIETISDAGSQSARMMRLRLVPAGDTNGEDAGLTSDSEATHNDLWLGMPAAIEAESVNGDNKEVRRAYILNGKQVLKPPLDPNQPPHFVLPYSRGARYPIDHQEDARLLSALVKSGLASAVRHVLTSLEPRLTWLEVLHEGDIAMIHGRIDLSQPVPLVAMGDGMVRLASLILVFSKTGNGVVLLDEIENGLHYSILDKVWEAIGMAARQFKVQVFATTHSFECIEAAHRAFRGEHADELGFYRLVEIDGKIENTRYSSETLADAIETGWEVR